MNDLVMEATGVRRSFRQGPVDLHVLQVSLVTLALTALATIYPAWRASRTMPAEALRHD